MSCSEKLAGSATRDADYEALNEVLPTVSVNDTEETKRSVGVFRYVFLGLCPDAICDKP